MHPYGNDIGDDEAGRLAEVLGQCGALAHLDLAGYRIADGVALVCASCREEWRVECDCAMRTTSALITEEYQ